MAVSLRVEVFPTDLDAAVAFYRDVLTFAVLRHEQAYASLARDSVRIVDDVTAERDRVLATGWPLHEASSHDPGGSPTSASSARTAICCGSRRGMRQPPAISSSARSRGAMATYVLAIPTRSVRRCAT